MSPHQVINSTPSHDPTRLVPRTRQGCHQASHARYASVLQRMAGLLSVRIHILRLGCRYVSSTRPSSESPHRERCMIAAFL